MLNQAPPEPHPLLKRRKRSTRAHTMTAHAAHLPHIMYTNTMAMTRLASASEEAFQRHDGQRRVQADLAESGYHHTRPRTTQHRLFAGCHHMYAEVLEGVDEQRHCFDDLRLVRSAERRHTEATHDQTRSVTQRQSENIRE